VRYGEAVTPLKTFKIGGLAWVFRRASASRKRTGYDDSIAKHGVAVVAVKRFFLAESHFCI
jgi:hypothetical protein